MDYHLGKVFRVPYIVYGPRFSLEAPLVAFESAFKSERSSSSVILVAVSIVCLSKFSRSLVLNSKAPFCNRSIIPQMSLLAPLSCVGWFVSSNAVLMRPISFSPLTSVVCCDCPGALDGPGRGGQGVQPSEGLKACSGFLGVQLSCDAVRVSSTVSGLCLFLALVTGGDVLEIFSFPLFLSFLSVSFLSSGFNFMVPAS